MFRLHYDTRIAQWVIQFHQYYIWWQTVTCDGAPLAFRRLVDAESYIKETGIDLGYDRWVARGMNATYVWGIQNGR